MSIFEKLSTIDVGNHIEKKGNLSYLSWAWAWAELKKVYPLSFYTVYENANGLNYHHDNKTGWVKVGVTVEEIEIIEYLPIMNFKNKSIVVDDITSMDVTKAIQRCATKAIGRHGLGLYIYAGEDLPEAQQMTPEELAEIERQQKLKTELMEYKQQIGSVLVELTNNGINKKAIENSISHHLSVKTLTECNDIEKLKAYYLKKMNDLTELKKEK